MGTFKTAIILVLAAFFLTGCSLSPEEKVGRELLLKQAVEGFVSAAVELNWAEVYRLSDGSFDSSEKLKAHLMKSWVSDATLTGGDVAAMAWINDKTAKVKVNWAFQNGSVQSTSSETFVWVWKGNAWKYKGRALR